jgi:hypothetical protein
MNTENQIADNLQHEQGVISQEIPLKLDQSLKSPQKNSSASHTSAESINQISILERRVDKLEKLLRGLNFQLDRKKDVIISNFAEFEDFFYKMLPRYFKEFLKEKSFSLKSILEGKYPLI